MPTLLYTYMDCLNSPRMSAQNHRVKSYSPFLPISRIKRSGPSFKKLPEASKNYTSSQTMRGRYSCYIFLCSLLGVT